MAEPSTSPLSLRSAARPGLLIGAAIAPRLLRDESSYAETVAREFSSLTPENVMKWEVMGREHGHYNFSPADELVEFAEKHGQTVHGHTLVWYRQIPDWVKESKWTRDEAIALLRQHIYTVAGRYRGRVQSWDVVNEAIERDLTYRKFVWLDTIGPKYIELAFRFAHEADPAAKLYYNDYGADAGGPKADRIYDMVKDLLDREVPIHGVGFQMHIGTGDPPTPEAVRANLERFAALGVDVEITEMDVALNQGRTPSETELKRQADIYGGILAEAVKVPRLRRISFWGVDDCHSWIQKIKDQPGMPLLFDCDYQPKPAYEAVRSAIGTQNSTQENN